MSEGTHKVTIYGWMGERLNLTGSDLIVYAAFHEAGTRGISVSGETLSASSLVGMNVSTFTRTRARLVIAGLVSPVETPDRGKVYVVTSSRAPVPSDPGPKPKPVRATDEGPGVAPLTEREEETLSRAFEGAYCPYRGDGASDAVEDALVAAEQSVGELARETCLTVCRKDGLMFRLVRTRETLSRLHGEVSGLIEKVSDGNPAVDGRGRDR